MEEIRTHRVGSITTGLSLIVFGILFLLRAVFGWISYDLIFKCWPLILIGLGLEVLGFNLSNKKFVYDKAAVFLLILMTLLVTGMAGADLCFSYMSEMAARIG